MYRQWPALFIGRSLPPRNNSHFGVRVTRPMHTHMHRYIHTERKKEKIEFFEGVNSSDFCIEDTWPT